MGRIEDVARSVGMVLHEWLPWQRKTQRESLAFLVATMLSERSANLMSGVDPLSLDTPTLS